MRTGIRHGVLTCVMLGLLVSSAAAQVVYKQFNDFRLPGVNADGNWTYAYGLGEPYAPMKSFKYLRIKLVVGIQSARVTNLSGRTQNYKNPPNFVIADPQTCAYLIPTTSDFLVTGNRGDHKALATFVGATVLR